MLGGKLCRFRSAPPVFVLMACAVVAGLLPASPSPAERITAGTFDPSFGNYGTTTVDLDSDLSSLVTAAGLARQSDGKLLVLTAGTHVAVLRFTSGGLLDSGFGTNGVVPVFAGLDVQPRSIRVDPQDRILCGGTRDQSQLALARLTPQGSPDNTFGSAGLVTTSIDPAGALLRDMALTSSGQILVAGGRLRSGGGSDALIVRYDSDGTRDTRFGSQGMVVSTSADVSVASGVLPLAKGAFLAGGTRGSDAWLARYQANGSLFTHFGTAGQVTVSTPGTEYFLDAMAAQSGGKMLLSGRVDTNEGTFPVLIRLTAKGKPDRKFGSQGIVRLAQTAEFGQAAVQPDGHIVTAGSWNGGLHDVFTICRFTKTGALDSRFGTNGLTQIPSSGDTDSQVVLVQPDGNIVAAGFSRVPGLSHTILDITRLLGR